MLRKLFGFSQGIAVLLSKVQKTKQFKFRKNSWQNLLFINLVMQQARHTLQVLGLDKVKMFEADQSCEERPFKKNNMMEWLLPTTSNWTDKTNKLRKNKLFSLFNTNYIYKQTKATHVTLKLLHKDNNKIMPWAWTCIAFNPFFLHVSLFPAQVSIFIHFLTRIRKLQESVAKKKWKYRGK